MSIKHSHKGITTYLHFCIIQAYVLYRLCIFLDIRITLTIIISICGLLSVYPIANHLIKKQYSTLRRILYIFAATYMGVGFIAFVVICLVDVVRFFFPIVSVYELPLILILTLILTVYAMYGALRLHVVQFTLPLRGLSKSIRFVHISDLHIGAVWSIQNIEKIVSKILDLYPDFVVITGDIFDGSRPMTPEQLTPFEKLSVPIYAVTGNHDYYQGGPQLIYDTLAQTPIQALKNSVVYFEDLQIIGVEYSRQKNHLQKILPAISYSKQKPSILLYHVPTHLSIIKKAQIQLQLSGHTHNGQIFPFGFVARLMYPYVRGLHESEEGMIYVNSGTLNGGAPLRLGSMNEITVITVVPAREKKYSPALYKKVLTSVSKKMNLLQNKK
jgi:uncharacterized protein